MPLKISKLIAAFLAVYVTAYFLLMRTDTPAIGTNGQPVFSSGFIFAPPQRVEGDLSVFGPRVSWANDLFLPIDTLWRRIRGFMPSRWHDEEVMQGKFIGVGPQVFLEPELVTRAKEANLGS